MDTGRVVKQRAQQQAHPNPHWRKGDCVNQTTQPDFRALLPVEPTRFNGGEPVHAVDARKLHAVLGSQQQFGNWITNKINAGMFEKGNDYIVFNNVINNPQGGRPANDYYLTLDTAKHIALMDHTPTGKRVRQYFIECEKELTQSRLPARTEISNIELFELALASAKENKARLDSLESRLTDTDFKIEALEERLKQPSEPKVEISGETKPAEVNPLLQPPGMGSFRHGLLYDLRKSQKISQAILAKRIGFSHACIGFWENGLHEPRPKAVRALAAYFRIPEEQWYKPHN